MGNTVAVDHEMDQYIKAHVQVQKRNAIEDLLRKEYINEAKQSREATPTIQIENESDMGKSEGTPDQEQHYEVLNDSI